MTSYNRDYAIPKTKPEPVKHIPYGRELTPMEKELVKRVQQDKKNWQEKIKRAQALEQQAARSKAKRERVAASSYEYDPA